MNLPMSDFHPRGVFQLPFMAAPGMCISVAINSQGCCIAWLHHSTADERLETDRTLWTLLDKRDPIAVLSAG
jgi:hypothetical protein